MWWAITTPATVDYVLTLGRTLTPEPGATYEFNALCWLAAVAGLLRLERRYEERHPGAYRKTRVVLWVIIAAAATIAFLLSWWSSLKVLPE